MDPYSVTGDKPSLGHEALTDSPRLRRTITIGILSDPNLCPLPLKIAMLGAKSRRIQCIGGNTLQAATIEPAQPTSTSLPVGANAAQWCFRVVSRMFAGRARTNEGVLLSLFKGSITIQKGLSPIQ